MPDDTLTGARLVEAVHQALRAMPQCPCDGLATEVAEDDPCPMCKQLDDCSFDLALCVSTNGSPVHARAAIRAMAEAAGVDDEMLLDGAARCVAPGAYVGDVRVAALLRALAEVLRDE